MKKLLSAGLLCALATTASGKDPTAKDFDNNYFVVTKTGLAVGTCDVPCSTDESLCTAKLLPTLAVHLDVDNVEFHRQSGFGACGQSSGLLPTPITPGTVLLSTKSFTDKREGRYCLLLQTVPLISVTRGIGAFAHTSKELGALSLRVHLADPASLDLVKPALAEWLTETDSLASAVVLGAKIEHSEAESSVKRIKLGMTTEEGEKTKGLPDTRVGLRSKLLYKYLNMTVVFENGGVTDVH